MTDLVKVEKEPWLTPVEWALALFPPLVWWAVLRTAEYNLRMKRQGKDRDHKEIRRRMMHRHFAAYRRICLVNIAVLGAVWWALDWSMFGMMAALATVILFMPSPEGMKKLQATEEKKMLDG